MTCMTEWNQQDPRCRIQWHNIAADVSSSLQQLTSLFTQCVPSEKIYREYHKLVSLYSVFSYISSVIAWTWLEVHGRVWHCIVHTYTCLASWKPHRHFILRNTKPLCRRPNAGHVQYSTCLIIWAGERDCQLRMRQESYSEFPHLSCIWERG